MANVTLCDLCLVEIEHPPAAIVGSKEVNRPVKRGDTEGTITIKIEYTMSNSSNPHQHVCRNCHWEAMYTTWASRDDDLELAAAERDEPPPSIRKPRVTDCF